jgi:hypothetical protein
MYMFQEEGRLNRTALHFAIGMGLACCPARAGIVENDFFSTTGFTVPGANLLQSATVGINNVSDIQPEEGVSTANLSILTDLAFGDPGLDNPSQVVTILSGAIITYTFSSPITVTSINTYVGWRDGGRENQDYTISYSLAGSATDFLPLYSVAYDPPRTGDPSDTAVSLSDTSGTILDGVAALQFSFPSVQNGYVGYRELNVEGTSDVPEPGTIVLTGILLLAWIFAANRELTVWRRRGEGFDPRASANCGPRRLSMGLSLKH